MIGWSVGSSSFVGVAAIGNYWLDKSYPQSFFLDLNFLTTGNHAEVLLPVWLLKGR